MEEKEILARNLIRYRKNAGLSQIELAKKLNYSNKNISKWENGETMPNAFVLQKIANIYGITIEDLLSEAPAQLSEPNPEKEIKNTSKRKFIFRLTMLLLANAIMYAIGTLLIYILKLVGISNFNFLLIYLYLSPATCLSITIYVRILYNIVDLISLTFFGLLFCLCFYFSFIHARHMAFIFVLYGVYEIVQVCIALLINIKLKNNKLQNNKNQNENEQNNIEENTPNENI